MKSTFVFCIATLFMSYASAFVSSPPAFVSTPNNSVSNTELAYKVVSSIGSLKNRPGCQVVRRRGRIYVINKTNPKFKVRQGGAKMRKNKKGRKG